MACFCCGNDAETNQQVIDPAAEDYSKARAQPVLPRDGGKAEGPPGSQRYTEYAVSITRPSGSRMGLELDIMDYKTAQVCEVMDGLVKEYNSSAAAGERMEVGDFICSVNGQSGDSKAILEELKTATRMELVCRRPIEYSVKIDTGGRPLGLILQHAPRSISLMVAEVKDGPIAEWTAGNPNRPVRVNDRIVVANGNRAAPPELLNEMQDNTHTTLEMTLISVLD